MVVKRSPFEFHTVFEILKSIEILDFPGEIHSTVLLLLNPLLIILEWPPTDTRGEFGGANRRGCLWRYGGTHHSRGVWNSAKIYPVYPSKLGDFTIVHWYLSGSGPIFANVQSAWGNRYLWGAQKLLTNQLKWLFVACWIGSIRPIAMNTLW